MSNYSEALQGSNAALEEILAQVNELPEAVTDAVRYTAQALTEEQRTQARMNIGLKNLTLGTHTDGLVYLFIAGEPVGNGIELPSGGISGYVDSENNIVINNLPDGSYAVKYEMTDGSTLKIGDLVLGSTGPSYTNLAEPNTDNTTDFTVWCSNARMGSSGSVSASDGYTCTNFVALAQGDVIRVQGFKIQRIGLYDADKNILPSAVGDCPALLSQAYIESGYIQTDDAATFTVAASAAYFRLSGWVNSTADAVIITRNEEIT